MPTLLRMKTCAGTSCLDAVRELRYRVLREPLGMSYETTLFGGDTLPSTLHVLALEANEPVGCLSLLTENADPPWIAVDGHKSPSLASISGDRAIWVQLRGMAVLQQRQGTGVGAALVSHSQEMARLNGWSLWCNARQSAVPFYARHGWRSRGEPFDIPGIGPHDAMQWENHLQGEANP